MHDVAGEHLTKAELLAQIAALRAQVAALDQRARELDELAHRDVLVPAANRRGLERELEIMVARYHRHGTPGAVLFIDLDGLKVLNDSFGHAGGDAALIHVVELLAQGTRATDCVARVGGDEFCVLLDQSDETGAQETAERLVDLIAAEDFLYHGVPMPLSVAIGFTMIEAGDTPKSVLARADRAMYRTKAAAAA